MAIGPNMTEEGILWACDQRDPRTLPPGVLNDARNLRYTDGLPGTRKGVLKPGWANSTSSSQQIIRGLGVPYGSGVFRDPNGLEWQLVAADGYVWRTRPHNQNTSLPLPTGVAIYGPARFVQAFDRVFLFRGRYLAPLVMTSFDTGFEDLLPHYDAATEYDAAIVATGRAADEVAFGPFQAVTSITRVDQVATVVTASPHGYVTGADVVMQGADQADYNGRFNITVVDNYTFTFAVYTEPVTPATGTITVSNMSQYWKALGSRVTLTSLTSVSTTATATKAAHGFSSGQYVTIAGATPAAYNGVFPITVIDADTFQYDTASAPGADATGTITAQTSVVFAGQDPVSNPEAWTRAYNILPNAETALFINDLLLVPTAYEPSSVDNYATFTGGSYKKTDYLVATNYLDYLHFTFANEFRINAGSADEIVDLFQFGASTVIVLKGKSFGILANVQGDLTQLTLDMRPGYGCVGRGAWAVAGSNAYFLSSGFGVVTLRQSDLGVLLGVNVPLSAPVQPTIQQVDWALAASRARMAHWQNKLYIFVPLTTGERTILVFDFVASVRLGNNIYESGVNTQGWTPRDTGSALDVLEFHKLNLNGEERLFFLDTAGYVNLYEECDRGDQIADANGPLGLGWEEIESYALSRTYEPSLKGQVRPVEEAFSLLTWDPQYSVNVRFASQGVSTSVLANKTRSNVKYDKPFDRVNWDESNVNDDWATPYRQDYHVTVPAGGLLLGSGIRLLQFQESLDTRRISGRQGKSFQLEFSNTQGRIQLAGQRISAVPGRDKKGVSI